MSLTLNMVGGGGSFTATDAILRVQAPATSVVTISKGSTVKTDYGHENMLDPTVYDYYFIIHQSQFDGLTPWSVIATSQGITNTKTIIINASDEYDLIFKLRIPDEYQEVEYIQATGTQYFVANFVNSIEFTIETDMMPIGNTGSSPATMYGGFSTSDLPTFGWYTNATNTYFWYDSISNAYITSPTRNNLQNVEHVFKVTAEDNTYTAYIDGEQKLSRSYTDFSASIPIYIFAFDEPDRTASRYGKGRLYTFKYSENDIVLHDYIPCYRKSDNVAGVYDKITGDFIINSGTGTFIVGGDIPS